MSESGMKAPPLIQRQKLCKIQLVSWTNLAVAHDTIQPHSYISASYWHIMDRINLQ